MARYEVRTNRIEPLWDRVDANRIRLGIFLVLFFAAATVSLSFVAVFAAFLAFVVLLGGLLEFGIFVSEDFGQAMMGLVPIVAAVAVFAYMLRALTRDDRWFARRLEATLVPRGELLPTKYALKDMAIASGFEVAPALYLIETPNVNAFVFQRGRRRAIIGVTRGLVERLSPDEQRAVFANLMARLQQGDMLWASAVTALMAPLWHMRDRQLTANEQLVYGESSSVTLDRLRSPELEVSSAEIAGIALLSAFVVVSELLAYGHRSSQLRHAETADAEGMLLLKDPQPMLSALEKSVRFNNYVPTAGPGMTQLFYCWTGDGSTDDDEDPENRRVVRLREVLGVEGADTRPALANEPSFVVAPPAPRLED